MNYHNLVKAAKVFLYPNGESYVFGKNVLRFKAGSRPIRRKYIDSQNDVVRNDLLQIEYFEKYFTPDDILWDIGSHNGHYTVFAASVVQGSNQVFSFEPDHIARDIQIENLRLNNLTSRAAVFNIAVSNKNGLLKFQFQGGDSNSHIVEDNFNAAGAEIITVESKTINSLLQELPRPTFVKIDTEGAEIDILSEATLLLSDNNVKFICELHPFAWESFKSSYDEFVNLLKEFNRDLKLLDNSKQIEDLPFYGTVLF
jgi:FkbM family methyltransferase